MNDSITDQYVDGLLDTIAVSAQLENLSRKLPDCKGAAIVCTSELSPAQIDEARKRNRLVVRADGIGFALVLRWRKK